MAQPPMQTGYAPHAAMPMQQGVPMQQGMPMQQGYPMQQGMPMQLPPTTTVVVQQPPPRPTSYLVLAVITTLCCNLIFGIVAIIFSVLSSSAADDGEMESARTKGRISCVMSLIGMFTTIIAIIVVIVYFVVIVKQLTDSASDILEDSLNEFDSLDDLSLNNDPDLTNNIDEAINHANEIVGNWG